MQKQVLDGFKKWFLDYVSAFYCGDEYFDANIKLKEYHSLMVCDEMDYLTDSLGLEENNRRIAWVTGLFHDLGRFTQFKRYQTYNDPKSVSHADLSLEVIEQTNILDSIEPEEKSLIVKAIDVHSRKLIPADLQGDELLYCKLIRDADKIDIFRVVLECYAEYAKNPDGFRLELELPEEPGYSDLIVDDILNQKRVDYANLTTWNDMKLLQLGWVYDINFVETLKRIRQRKFLEKVLEYLPATEDVRRVGDAIFDYVNSRIEGNGSTKS